MRLTKLFCPVNRLKWIAYLVSVNLGTWIRFQYRNKWQIRQNGRMHVILVWIWMNYHKRRSKFYSEILFRPPQNSAMYHLYKRKLYEKCKKDVENESYITRCTTCSSCVEDSIYPCRTWSSHCFVLLTHKLRLLLLLRLLFFILFMQIQAVCKCLFLSLGVFDSYDMGLMFWWVHDTW